MKRGIGSKGIGREEDCFIDKFRFHPETLDPRNFTRYLLDAFEKALDEFNSID